MDTKKKDEKPLEEVKPVEKKPAASVVVGPVDGRECFEKYEKTFAKQGKICRACRDAQACKGKE